MEPRNEISPSVKRAIQIVAWIISLPLLALAWSYVIISVSWYMLTANRLEKDELIAYIMLQYKVPFVSMWFLIKIKALNALEPIQNMSQRTLWFFHLILWTNIILFFINYFK
jgi:hypothetical protein